MRFVLLLTAMLVMLPTFAAAKSVLYITNSATDSTCSDLSLEDKTFCNMISSLGYTVQTINDAHVFSDTSEWQNRWTTDDMIFIGNVDQSLLKTGDAATFCGNIKDTQKPVFVAFNATYKNSATNNEGCAGYFGIVQPVPDNNICTAQKKSKVQNAGYITSMWDVGDRVDVYNNNHDITITTPQNSGNLTFECNIGGIGFYPAVTANTSGAFWGLNNPSDFTQDGEDFFYRTILYLMGDYKYTITPAIVPQKVTANSSIILYATISGRNGIVSNVAPKVFDGTTLVGQMTYNNISGKYELPLVFDSPKNLLIQVDDSTENIAVNVGDLAVTPVTTYYSIGNTTLRAEAPSGSGVNYRILDNNFSVLKEGSMVFTGQFHEISIQSQDWGPVYFEVTGTKGSDFGGAVKAINKLNASASLIITPDEWVVTLVNKTSSSKAFSVKGNNITGLTISDGDFLKDYVTFDTTNLPPSIAQNQTGTFVATLDAASLQRGVYSGRVVVYSDQIQGTIPITLYYVSATGNALNVKESILTASSLSTKPVVSVTLLNTGTVPITDISVSGTGELSGKVKFSDDPGYVPAGGQKQVKVEVTTPDPSERKNDGSLIFSSELGTVEVQLRFVQGTPPDVDNLEARLKLAKENFGDQITPEAQVLISDIEQLISEIRNALSVGNVDLATTKYSEASTKISQLENLIPEPNNDATIILVVIILVVLAAVGWYAYNKYFKKKKKGFEPTEEEFPNPEDELDKGEYY